MPSFPPGGASRKTPMHDSRRARESQGDQRGNMDIGSFHAAAPPALLKRVPATL